jgi:hypothetical protein
VTFTMNLVAVDQAVVILRCPIQSDRLLTRNIDDPRVLLHTDVRNVATMKSRKRVADTYMDSLTIERSRFPRSISQNDYSEAQRYSVGIYVADLLLYGPWRLRSVTHQHMKSMM